MATSSSNPRSPSTRMRKITPNDTVDLVDIPRSVYVGTGGTLTMIGLDDPVGTLPETMVNVPSGSLIAFRPRRILATGTTAADLVGFL